MQALEAEFGRTAVVDALRAEADALRARVSAGEAQSFRALVDRHLPTVLAIARRMLRDDAEAEDVAQETLLRLWRNAGSLELGDAGVRPWLRRVASNLCIDRVRARRNASRRGSTSRSLPHAHTLSGWMPVSTPSSP